MFEGLRGWTAVERKVVTASFLAGRWTRLTSSCWFSCLTMSLGISAPPVARWPGSNADFGAAAGRRLHFRPPGDRFGRRPILMLDVALYSLMGLASALAPNLTTFLIIGRCSAWQWAGSGASVRH